MTTPLDIYSIVGFAGTACIIGAYFYLTAVEKPSAWVLHGTNLTGAALLTISLLVHTNWPSLVLEGFWAAIAVWGLAKAWRGRSKTKEGMREA
ncbi:MAG: permease [Alteraurantiacibacter sp.]